MASAYLPARRLPTRPFEDCNYGLARDGGHSVVMVVFKPFGAPERVLYFADNAFVYYESNDAGGQFIAKESDRRRVLHPD